MQRAVAAADEAPWPSQPSWLHVTMTTRGARKTSDLVPLEAIQHRILILRGAKVLLDVDLAKLYGVSTKRLNEQVKRNIERFPKDFMFQLTAAEKDEVAANCDHLLPLKFSPNLPYAFTEHGALMAANALRSPQAIRMSVFIDPPKTDKLPIGFHVRERRTSYRPQPRTT